MVLDHAILCFYREGGNAENLSNSLTSTIVTGIKFLHSEPSGYTKSDIGFNGIKIYYNGPDIAYVYQGDIFSENNSWSMFCQCTALASIDLTNFNTSNVVDMSGMFLDCRALTEITFGVNFGTSNVESMREMLYSWESSLSRWP